MSSPQDFQFSSPISTIGRRRQKSRYTYRNLTQLAQSSTSCPLRVIAHVDLDAFYAQCEMVRLGLPEAQPLAVQQWQGLIAINYAARNFGLSRHVNVIEAKKLCPNLIMQHVPTWKEGYDKWAYHEDASRNMATHKVSLDPYRLESRRIITCIKNYLPIDSQRVEKASVDEVFLDLSAQVYSELLKRYPELEEAPPYDDPTEFLPPPPSTVLDWKADALIDLSIGETENDDPDWDDIAILIGSEIIRDLRSNILRKLKYTCSAGIAQNKMLAKLGSGHKKPNQQTVIRNRAISKFLSEMKFIKIRGLGGKLGEQITSKFNTDEVEQLLSISIDRLKLKLGSETGTWVYQIIRGIDISEVNSRTQIKSMLSAKSFRPSINTSEQAYPWLRIFAADIYSRLVEEGVLENKRRPKTMNLHCRQGIQNRSRSCTLLPTRVIDEIGLFEMSKNLLSLIVEDGQIWPCTNLSLSIGGLEDGIMGNMNIGAYLVKGDDAMIMEARNSRLEPINHDHPEKRRRIETSTGIQNYFQRKHNNRLNVNEQINSNIGIIQKNDRNDCDYKQAGLVEFSVHLQNMQKKVSSIEDSHVFCQGSDLICTRCKEKLDSSNALQSHQDWHMAQDLQNEERKNLLSLSKPSSPNLNANTLTSSKKRKLPEKIKRIQGQSTLNFG
ncbi:N-acetyltransferase eso1 [Erysiphe neolycopersici]|uniref:DNA polymerase eta n=1 Tax=Erysiphe neolycopersici TaxID=212602 RepID=A0A420HYE5_9PEZI|nr:N-acetyltransferase eso1 [Erysiphe neolycopersici]